MDLAKQSNPRTGHGGAGDGTPSIVEKGQAVTDDAGACLFHEILASRVVRHRVGRAS